MSNTYSSNIVIHIATEIHVIPNVIHTILIFLFEKFTYNEIYIIIYLDESLR